MVQYSQYRNNSRELPWELRRRGLKDSLRHDQRVKEAVRKNLRELIAEEAIITSNGTKRIRIPLRYLGQYRSSKRPAGGLGLLSDVFHDLAVASRAPQRRHAPRYAPRNWAMPMATPMIALLTSRSSLQTGQR
jgi:hypothetical protein